VGLGEPLVYRLTYDAGDVGHTVTIFDEVPAATTVVTAASGAGPAPVVNGQRVTWTGAVAAHQTVTLTIQAQGAKLGGVRNTATFSGTEVLIATTEVFVYGSRILLPVALRTSP
jgi:hypothetical protein